MSISAMKQALDAIETYGPEYMHGLSKKYYIKTLRQAIAEAEKQEPWVKTYCGGKPNYTTPEQEPVAIVSGYTNGECVVTPINPAVVFSVGTSFSYTAPVHASDISQERVDETAKGGHEFECPRCGHCCKEWVGLDGDIPGLGLVTEEFYNGMLCAEDILRRRNT